ncbi:AAA family ATPase [Nocardia sp. NPDC087230]|uniref:AAA family ATPase n=1 Tax=Nocardia sp. NPDC087230 TaxID=3364331 RepID=UPI00382931CC
MAFHRSDASSTASVLVVLRGNSASGKSTVAHAVEQRFPRASCLVASQDMVRRKMLRETDAPAAVNIDLIEHVAAFGLARGLIVIVEGILDADRYAEMLERLSLTAGSALFYSFDLTFEETLRRHERRPQAQEFSPKQMAQWYHGWQPLPFVDEVRINASWSLGRSVDQIYFDIRAAIDLDQEPA